MNQSTTELVNRAAEAAAPFAATTPHARAVALVTVANSLEAHNNELVTIAIAETGLSEARLRGELKRTMVQLKLFADTVVAGAYLDVRIDRADPNFVLGPRPDLRRYLVPLGPIINFAASNFPFAFSVAGGDTAAALAAGCPVILKGHSGHPKLSQRTAEIVAAALAVAKIPANIFQLVTGQTAGVAVLQHPLIKAGSFTGSIRVGRMLADIAAARSVPIPFFGELGSVNPVFVTAAAITERAEELVTGLVTSVSGSAGQLCTKPGFVFVPTGHGLNQSIAVAAAQLAPQRMLNPTIASSYRDRREAVLTAVGVRPIFSGEITFDADGQGFATPTFVALSVETALAAGKRIMDESFGPLAVLVEYEVETDLAGLVPQLFAGNLTATIHAGTGEVSAELRALIKKLSDQVGRVLFGGWPTGVAVTPAMQHGGPWPATTNDSSTSVGTAAIQRFLRPVAYQNAVEEFLPPPLQLANPWQVPQTIAAAGESSDWGSRWVAHPTG